MKPLLALPIALLLAAPTIVAIPTAADPGSPSEYPHDPAAIVRIECHSDTDSGIGTAVKVGRYTYITAAHVADGRICTIGGQPVAVTVSGGEHRDFATLTGPASNVFLPISCKGFRFGRIYLARGYAGGGYALAAQPWLATSIPWGRRTILLGEAYPGMSGGPLIDRKGRVRGVVNTRLPSMALPLSETSLCP